VIKINLFKKKDNTQVVFRNQKLVLNLELLKTISGKMGWQGKGTREDPIVITGNNIPLKLLFSKSDLFLNIKNLNLTSLTLYRCSNITIENCKIHNLVLNRSQHNTVRNNSIMIVEYLFSRANKFKENGIRRVKNSNYETKHFDVFSYLSIIFGLLLVLSALRDMIAQNVQWISLFVLIMGILITFSIGHFLYVRFQIRKLLPNEFHNNSSISRLKQIFNHGILLEEMAN